MVVMAAPVKVRATEDALTAQLCRNSFFEFVVEFWDVLIAETPQWNWHIQYLCAQLQATAERVFRGEPRRQDIICNVPPGTTKSTIFSIMFPAWVWTRMPSARFITASYTQDLAWDMAYKSRELIESEKYRRCFPEIKLKRDQNTKSYFANTRHGFRRSIGVGTAIIGFHAHFQVVDDPIDPTGVVSDDILATVNNWLVETLFQRKVDKKVTVFMMIMQRLAQNDPTGYLLDKHPDRYRHYCLPAEIEDVNDAARVKPYHLVRYYKDGLLDPVRLDKDVLKEKYDELLDYGYACQFKQTPIPKKGAMFQVEKITIEEPPTGKYMVRTVRYWDKAATPGGGTFSVGAKMGVDSWGYTWILDIVRGQWDTGTREMTIVQTAEADGVATEIGLEQEPGSGGKESAEETAKRLRGYTVRINRPSGDKALRADPFSSHVNNGLVKMAPGPWNNILLSEMRFFPHSTYKDQVDGLSGGFTMIANAPIVVGAIDL